MKNFLAKVGFILLMMVLFWHGFTTNIYALKHPEKTRTQLFLHIPKSFILDFKE
jgi:hypothetical protein